MLLTLLVTIYNQLAIFLYSIAVEEAGCCGFIAEYYVKTDCIPSIRLVFLRQSTRARIELCCGCSRKDQILNSTTCCPSVRSHWFCAWRPSSDSNVGIEGSWSETAAAHKPGLFVHFRISSFKYEVFSWFWHISVPVPATVTVHSWVEPVPGWTFGNYP